jgi:hypothetical protein
MKSMFQIELNTLETTVKQLERQKGEAGRRLNDLDSQRDAMAKTATEFQDKVALEMAEVSRLRTEAQMSVDSARVRFFTTFLLTCYRIYSNINPGASISRSTRYQKISRKIDDF